MKLFEFGEGSRNVLYPILFTYFLMLEGYSMVDSSCEKLSQVFVLTFFFNISAILSGIFELIIYVRFKIFKDDSKKKRRRKINI